MNFHWSWTPPKTPVRYWPNLGHQTSKSSGPSHLILPQCEQFRVKMSGSQSCKDSSATWFVRYKDGIIECSVDEELIHGSRVCHVTCQQVCRANIGYLHFRVHSPTRLNRSLALCHYALTTNFKAVNPRLRIVWLYLMLLCRCDDGHSAWAALKWSRSKYSICYGIELFSVPRNVKHL